jgi:hypothetical protein
VNYLNSKHESQQKHIPDMFGVIRDLRLSWDHFRLRCKMLTCVTFLPVIFFVRMDQYVLQVSVL